MTDRIFTSQNELIQFAKNFLKERVVSLENDTTRCLKDYQDTQPAPFPALLYCFSTIDLLGSLYKGDADTLKKGLASQQSREFMMNFMNYTEEQASLLQNIFRHKLVHLAQPRPITKLNNENIAWKELNHSDRKNHLRLVDLEKGKWCVEVVGKKTVEVTKEFVVSIVDLKDDIKESVIGHQGYLEKLQFEPVLQDNLEKVVKTIYNL